MHTQTRLLYSNGADVAQRCCKEDCALRA
jgi:hypothetical protein